MPRGRPPKPQELVTGHLTKAEREEREKGEQSLKASAPFGKWPRTKKNRVASKHFDKLAKAFRELEMSDVMYEAVLNRYCIIMGECDELEKQIPLVRKTIERTDELWEKKLEEEDVGIQDVISYTKAMAALQRQLYNLDCALGAKRNALLQIEKENIMTVLAKLRAVPKKSKEEGEGDEMSGLLSDGDELAAKRMRKGV